MNDKKTLKQLEEINYQLKRRNDEEYGTEYGCLEQIVGLGILIAIAYWVWG